MDNILICVRCCVKQPHNIRRHFQFSVSTVSFGLLELRAVLTVYHCLLNRQDITVKTIVYVSEISTEYFNGVANYLTVYYQKTPNPEPPVPQSQTIFNIGTVTNSVIGNNNSVSVSIQEMKERAERDGGDDKETLQEIISILEKILAGQETPKPGLLSKFGACMERNSWITGAIASALINWLI